ncbi:MAG: hydroxymethylglutaryl-CoA lyase [Planctomycetes bacterium]|nr:hydroxymethylglutaryl-CoA lyase [Planctomycetota bacterium]
MTHAPPSDIRVTECGPRDGLQNEATILSIDQKVALIDLLSASGVAEIEVSSFVSPTWVPQLADAEQVFARISRRDSVVYSALVPNEEGMRRAMDAKIDKIAIFTAASETFSRKNTNATIAQTLRRFEPVVAQAKDAGLPVRAYISCVVTCPYEGPVDPRQVRDVASQLLDLGVDEIDLGETIGVAVPTDIDRLYEGLAGLLEPGQTTLHLHDTRGTALVCAMRALQLGVTSFDSSCGGLGGCPYAPNAAGNLATEDLVYLCNRMGYETSVDLAAVFAASRHIAAVLGRALPGRVFTADGSASSCADSTAS